MKVFILVLSIFLSATAYASSNGEYCGYINKVIEDYEAFGPNGDIRTVLYNKEWSQKIITVQDQKFTRQMAQLISEVKKQKYEMPFSWAYYEDRQQDKPHTFYICVYSPDKLRAVKRAGQWKYYLSTIEELMSVKVNNKEVDFNKILNKYRYTSKENQLLCKKEYTIDFLADNFHGDDCGFYSGDIEMCYTGNPTELVEYFDLLWTGDEYSLHDVIVSKKQIKIQIVDDFTMGSEGASEEEYEEYMMEYTVPHCKKWL